MLILGFFLLNGALVVGSQPKSAGTPENITVQVIDSKTVEVFWSSAWKNVERYDISYNPTENRVVSQAAGNSHSIILRELRPNTQYQVTVTAVVGGKNYKSRRLVFRTSADPDDSLSLEGIKPIPTKPSKLRKTYPVTPEVINPDPTAIGSKYTPPTSTTVRGVEIGLVLLALVVWIIAIALFFHRWGKIRMLLPYQPDYKTQQSLKVPGTGTTIVSGCTGNSGSQGQQDGPGCVQDLRWSNRLFEESSTAKKCSPARKPLRPRVSSAIFPASPSFCYVRTSTECNSPRIIRHAHSRSEFPTESIPLCQVNQPRSKSRDNIISITIPVIANSVNETALNRRKDGESKAKEFTVSEKKNLKDDAITTFEESELCKKENFPPVIDDDDNNKCDTDDDDYSRSFYQNANSGFERKERPKDCNSPSELEPLFYIETTNTRFQESPKKTSPEKEKPRRYNRSSFKKQKNRLYDDRDLLNPIKNVPIFEPEFNSPPQESENDKNKKPKDLKAEEMRRKALLRKVSLQDTYVNYNQDYWLDFKKSGKFHKSIDLGCFESEDKGNNNKTEGFKKKSNIEDPNLIWEDQFAHGVTISNQIQPLATKNQSKLPLTFEGSLKKSDSDPVIFPSICSCENCQFSDLEKGRNESKELLVELITQKEVRQAMDKKNNWFFQPSTENVLLFSERNGLIDTDFDMLNAEECLLVDTSPGGDTAPVLFTGKDTESTDSECKEKGFESPTEFSNFYEIKLTQEDESQTENLEGTMVSYFQESKTVFETFSSGSGEQNSFFGEINCPAVTESGNSHFSFPTQSSFCPPTTSHDQN